jgi:hypothetical protein
VGQSVDGGLSNLWEPLGGRRLPGRRDREENEVSLTGADASGEVHGATLSGPNLITSGPYLLGCHPDPWS